MPKPLPRPTHYASFPEIKNLYADECQSCGMCCIYYFTSSFRCPVQPEPYQQPPKKLIQIGKRTLIAANEFAPVVETTKFLRNKPDPFWKEYGRCAALQGVQGRKVSCGIYSQRPHACSDYEPGSADCFRIRRWAGLEPIDDGYGHS